MNHHLARIYSPTSKFPFGLVQKSCFRFRESVLDHQESGLRSALAPTGTSRDTRCNRQALRTA